VKIPLKEDFDDMEKNVTAELHAVPMNPFDDFVKHLERCKRRVAGKGDGFEGKQNRSLLSSCVICSYKPIYRDFYFLTSYALWV
jgi:hypothetical protein